MGEDTITVTVPRAAAERLAEVWENGDGYETGLTVAVRDLFAGQDGFLHTLNDALGREH